MVAIFPVWRLLVLFLPLVSLPQRPPEKEPALPVFGRDTVLVYRGSNENEGAFVVRIAEFTPDRYVEWEDSTTQGTIFMPAKAVTDARGFTNWRLYEGGVDTRGKDATTLWLSARIFRELKQNQKAKIMMDSLPTLVTLTGSDQLVVEVNRSQRPVPVIKTRDERGGERWFLDMEDNALLVNSIYSNYRQRLTSITTDRPNTLRWIKGKKIPVGKDPFCP